MNVTELFTKLKDGDVTMRTELGTRDEAKQTKVFAQRYTKLKTVTGLNEHALVMKDLVVPFNPMTCEVDTNYTVQTPFRPILLVEQGIELIKTACVENPALAEKWTARLGGKLSDGVEATLDDYYLFKAAGFIKPRIMTYHTVSVMLPEEFGGSGFKQKYTVDSSELGPDLTYPPNKRPIWDQAAIFFSALIRPEWDAMRKTLEREQVGKERMTSEKRRLYSRSPIGFVSPTNLIAFIDVPIGTVPTGVDPKDPKSIEKFIKFYGYNAKWTDALSEAMKNNEYDTDMNFFDFTIRTPASDAVKVNGSVYTDNDSMEIYQAMTITATDGRVAIVGGRSKDASGASIPNEKAFAPLMATAKAYFLYSQEESSKPDGDTFEKIMAASNRFNPIWTIQDDLLPMCRKALSSFKDSKYFNDKFKMAHSRFLLQLDASAAPFLAAYDDDEIEKEEKVAQASIKDLVKETRSGMGEDAGDQTIEFSIAE